MAIRKKSKRVTGRLFANSQICRLFVKMASYLADKAGSGITGKIFSSYDDESYEKGLFHQLTKRFDLGKMFFRPVKRIISKLVSSSILINKADSFLQGVLYTKLNVYGLVFITSGIGFLLVNIMKLYVHHLEKLSFVDTFVAAILVLLSLPLLFSSSSLSNAVISSRTARKLIFERLGCKEEAYTKEDSISGHSKTALPFGLLLCVLSWWIRPVYIVFALIVTVLAIVSLYSPESAVLMLITVLPFLSFERLCIILAYIAVCFLLKYVRGKRTIKSDPLAVAVLGFLILVLFNYRTSELGAVLKTPTMQMVCGICMFFLTVNLMKSKKWIKRCVCSICTAAFLASVYGALGYVAARFDVEYIGLIMSNGTLKNMISYFSDTAHLSQYLLICMFFVLASFKKEIGADRGMAFWAFVLSAVCLFMTQDYKTVICLFGGLLMIMMLYSKKSLAVMLFGLCVLPFAAVISYPYLAERISISELSLFNRVDGVFANHGLSFIFRGAGIGSWDGVYGGNAGSAHRLIVETGVVGLVVFGIIMFLALQKNTTLYSKGCSSQGKLISLVAVSAAYSLVFRGDFVNIFADYRVNLMFWFCIALSSCVASTERGALKADGLSDM